MNRRGSAVWWRMLAVGAVVLLASGCAGGEPDPGEGPGAEGPSSGDVERAAMECVTGAWVAETAALQQLIDEAAGDAGMRLIMGGSIVYEFLEHGFGLNVIPTEFSMSMVTSVGTVVGTMTGTASGVWTVKREHIHAAGDSWQTDIDMRWTFEGADMEVDTGAQSLMDGFIEVDRVECDGDTLILQSKSGPPLTLARMTEVG